MFYAYLPNDKGQEPVGGSNRLIRHDLKDSKYFVRLATKILGPGAVCFRVENFYDFSTFKKVN